MKKISILILSLMTSFGYAQTKNEGSVQDSSFIIVEKYMPVYTGTYKDGKPYDGYFKVNLPGLGFFLVNYYDAEVLKYQYSKELLDDQGNLGASELNLKATYKDGKINDGREYVRIDNGLTVKTWKEGRLDNFTVDLFAMNYFNRLTIQKKPDEILITNLEDTISSIRIFIKDGHLTTDLSAKGVSIFYNQQIDIKTHVFPVNSIITGIRKGNDDFANALRIGKIKEEPLHVYKINTKLFMSMFLPKTKDLDVAFQYLADFFSKDEALLYVYKSGAAPKEKFMYLINMETGQDGKIKKGITWMDGAQPYYQIYDKGKVVKKEAKSLVGFQKIIQAYAEKLYAE